MYLCKDKYVGLFICLANWTDRKGKCWSAIATIARELKLSETTVRRAVKDLRKAGLIKTEQRYRDSEVRAISYMF